MADYILYTVPGEEITEAGLVIGDAGACVKIYDLDTGAILFVPYAWITSNVRA